VKLPVANTLGNREASLDKDALMRNAVAEVDEQAQIVRARKRPATDSAFTAASGVGQGLFVWTIPGPLEPTQVLIAITDDILNTSPTPIPKALAFTVQPT
jgi:hypothetical protein